MLKRKCKSIHSEGPAHLPRVTLCVDLFKLTFGVPASQLQSPGFHCETAEYCA